MYGGALRLAVGWVLFLELAGLIIHVLEVASKEICARPESERFLRCARGGDETCLRGSVRDCADVGGTGGSGRRVLAGL